MLFRDTRGFFSQCCSPTLTGMTELLCIAGLLAVVWYWQDSRKATEIAIRHCRSACRKVNVQLLDETVFRSVTRLKRNTMGQVSLLRTFEFEFAAGEDRRYQGQVTLLGIQLQELHMDLPEEGATGKADPPQLFFQ